MSSNSPHLEADRNLESTEELEVEALVSSSESSHLEADQSSEKGKYLGRISQDHALRHCAPSLCVALRASFFLGMVLVRVLWSVVGANRELGAKAHG